MPRSRACTLLVVSMLLVAPGLPACAAESPATQPAKGASPCTPVKGTVPVKPKSRPDRIQVQHLLIAFDGSLPGQKVGRTQEEAKELAYRLLEEARCGADFDTLVKAHTNDSFPGIYGMSNFGIAPNEKAGEYARERMVAAFGDVGFEISPGNIGMADFDAKKSPFGWHIIKRLK